MGKPDGLTKRKGSSNWYYRRRCPKHLRRPGVPAEVWISLETDDYKRALTKHAWAAEDAMRRFAERLASPSDGEAGINSRTPRLRRPEDPHLPILARDDAASLAVSFFRRALQELDAQPTRTANMDPDDLADWTQELEHREATLRSVRNGEEHPAYAAETQLLKQAGFRSPVDSEPSVLLREYLLRAMLQLIAIERARLRGDYSVGNTDPLFNASQPPVWATSVRGAAQITTTTVKEAADRYLAHLLRTHRKQKTQDRYRDEIAHIVAFFGPSTPMDRIRLEQCHEFQGTFALLPPNFARKLVDGITITDLAVRRAPDDPVLSWATHEKYLSALTRFMAWAHKADVVEKNYADGLNPLGKKPDGSVAKFPFEDDELQRIFLRPIYTGCVNDERGFAKPGTNIIRRSRYWAPLISLFAGLRAGEILQLTPDHFRVSPAGSPFIVLTPDMKLKNDNAQREIPVHPMLQQIGLLDWVERRRASLSSPLFPEVPKDKYEAESPIFSKRFASDLKHLKLGERREKLTFHSFRHCFKRALDRASIAEQQKDELCGWARGKKTGRRYGTGLEADVLKPCLEAVSYQIDLQHLTPHARFED